MVTVVSGGVWWRRVAAMVGVVLAVGAGVSGCAAPTADSAPSPTGVHASDVSAPLVTGAVTRPGKMTTARMVRVIDGDTVIVATDTDSGHRQVRVRLIGVDTPETVKPHTPVQCWGPQASALTKHLAAEGMAVRLEHDPVAGDTDTYGRMLAYVWLDSGVMLNYRLIADGAGREYDFHHQPYRYRAQFQAAQTMARAHGVGVWGQC